MEPQISLQAVTENAQEIRRLLTERFDHKLATERTEKLYQTALLIIRGQCENKALFPEIVSPVVSILNDVICLESIQNLDPLLRALGKTYRVFVELAWYQCWHQKQRLTHSETVEKIRDNCSLMQAILPKDEFLARFEYSCTEQALRLLKPTENIWFKYLTLIPKAGAAGANLSIGESLEILKQLMEFVQRDWLKSWYPEVHYMRWMSACVRTVATFNEAMGIRIEQFLKEGKKYTECLAIIYMDFIKDQSLVGDFRQFAAKQLSDLLLLEDREQISRAFSIISAKSTKPDELNRFVSKLKEQAKSTSAKLKRLDHSFKEKIHYKKGSLDTFKALPRKVSREFTLVFNKVAQKADRYWSTRGMIMSQLVELHKEERYCEYLRPCIESLNVVLNRPVKDKLRQEIEFKFRDLQERHGIDVSSLDQAFEKSIHEVNKKGKETPVEEGHQHKHKIKNSVIESLECALKQINEEELVRVRQIYEHLNFDSKKLTTVVTGRIVEKK